MAKVSSGLPQCFSSSTNQTFTFFHQGTERSRISCTMKTNINKYRYWGVLNSSSALPSLHFVSTLHSHISQMCESSRKTSHPRFTLEDLWRMFGGPHPPQQAPTRMTPSDPSPPLLQLCPLYRRLPPNISIYTWHQRQIPTRSVPCGGFAEAGWPVTRWPSYTTHCQGNSFVTARGCKMSLSHPSHRRKKWKKCLYKACLLCKFMWHSLTHMKKILPLPRNTFHIIEIRRSLTPCPHFSIKKGSAPCSYIKYNMLKTTVHSKLWATLALWLISGFNSLCSLRL